MSVILRDDGWYWFSEEGNLVGPYETRGEAQRALECENDWEADQYLTDAEADADALASAGWGTDEDYGGYQYENDD